MYSKNQNQILTLFFSQPKAKWHLQEIGRILNKKPGVFQKAINSLERDGVLLSEKRGNQRLCSLNHNYPLLKELKQIIQKTTGIEGMLKEAVSNERAISLAFIFGSYAKNQIHSTSDIDLVVVGKPESDDALLQVIERIERFIQREINVRFFTIEEYAKKKKQKNVFLNEILNDKYILLKGKP